MVNDPDLCELLEEFISLIPERIRSIRNAVATGDRSALCTLVHQLRGACGSYGFHDMTPLSSNLEAILRSDKQLEDLVPQIETFLEACSRMTSSAN